MKGRFFLKSFALLGSLLALSCMLLAVHAEARNIKVGIIDCYSGPPAVYGEDALNGFKLALEEINKEGVLGGKIEFTTRDTKFKVDLALNMAKELVMREEIDVLVGTINSGAALAPTLLPKRRRCLLLSGSPKVEESLEKRAIVMSSPPVKIVPWAVRSGELPCLRNLMSNTGWQGMTMSMATPLRTLPGAISKN